MLLSSTAQSWAGINKQAAIVVNVLNDIVTLKASAVATVGTTESQPECDCLHELCLYMRSHSHTVNAKEPQCLYCLRLFLNISRYLKCPIKVSCSDNLFDQ